MSSRGEPRVLTSDLQQILRSTVAHGPADGGMSAAKLAEKADTSTRTINRIIGGKTKTTDLDLADRLLVQVGRHLSEVRVVYPDGSVED